MSDLVTRWTQRPAAEAGLTIPAVRLSGPAIGLVLAAWYLTAYPLPVWPLLAIIGVYAVGLWWWPPLFLVIMPIVLPAYDLGLWTGWMAVGESDPFVLVTVAVLLLRNPPAAGDLRMAGGAGMILAAFTGCWVIATVAGLSSPLGAGESDDAFLRPDNALRLAKPLAEALLLLPFLRHRERTRGDAVILMGWGMAAGLAVVTLIVVAERLLFAGIFDFGTSYRAAGPFSSMRVGGGHIGAYAAMALPFALTLIQLRPRWLGIVLALLACLCGGYSLSVTFARTAYAACLVGMTVSAAGCVFLASRNRIRVAAAGVVPVVAVIAALAAVAGLTGMHARFAASAMDFLTRQDNWRAGLAVRDDGVAATVFGMGLGTYQRAMLVRSPIDRPSDLVVRGEGGERYVLMRVESPFYLGQKIAAPSGGGAVALTVRARSPDRATSLDVLICDKVLLYSDNCRGAQIALPASGQAGSGPWTTFHAAIPMEGLGGTALGGLLRRPVELSLTAPLGQSIELGAIGLTDVRGNALLANGNFAHGLDRWIFTDDSHVSYRMLNEYLMLFFETGILGVVSYVALAGVAIAGGVRALRSSRIAGAATTGAVAAFLVSGLFDNVLEAPRVAALFLLICLCGLIQWQEGYAARNSLASASHS